MTMKVSGTATLSAPPDRVWQALNDPAVLVRTIPGCQRLEAVGEDSYRMTVAAGVASIKGLYQGEVSISEQEPPDRFVLTAAGSGAPGTVSARVLVSLAGAGDGTTLTYDADAIVGGMIGGVGQRMLTGVAKKTAGEFFSAVDDVLNGRAPAPALAAAAGGAPVADGSPQTVFEAPGAGAVLAGGSSEFVRGAVIGVAATVLGTLIGGWIAGRRR
jgi:carbon monoxide dehydrogenase subunit G